MKVYSRDKYLLLSELNGLADHQKAMQLPANKKWRGKELQFIPSVASVSYIVKTWDEVEWSEGMALEFYNLYKYYENVRQHHKDIIADIPSSKHKFKTKPYDHQRKVFDFSNNFTDFALLMEQGTGYSHVAINTAA